MNRTKLIVAIKGSFKRFGEHPSFLNLGVALRWNRSQLGTVKMHFRIFTSLRSVHTFVYAIVAIPQPARALSFVVGSTVNIYMAHSIIKTCSFAM